MWKRIYNLDQDIAASGLKICSPAGGPGRQLGKAFEARIVAAAGGARR
jgi:hypothetical protein